MCRQRCQASKASHRAAKLSMTHNKSIDHSPYFLSVPFCHCLQHPAICEFPSKQFYEGKLETDRSVKERAPDGVDFWPARDEQDQHVPLVFCHVEGTEEALVVTTEEGSEQSKSNVAEQKKTVRTMLEILCLNVLYCIVPCRAMLLCCAVLYYAVMLCCDVLLCVAECCCTVLTCAVLYRAILCYAMLCCAVLCCAVLCRAVLYYAMLCCVVLCYAVLCCAMLCCVVLYCAVLCCAVLCCAVLCWAGLGWAGLGWAGLGWAGLCCAVLCCAVLCRHVIWCDRDVVHRRWRCDESTICFICDTSIPILCYLGFLGKDACEPVQNKSRKRGNLVSIPISVPQHPWGTTQDGIQNPRHVRGEKPRYSTRDYHISLLC